MRAHGAEQGRDRGLYVPAALATGVLVVLGEQVGCTYTAQRFEVDCIGVIWGKDLTYSFDDQTSEMARNALKVRIQR